MIGSQRLKVCGLTRAADIAIAQSLGIDYFGINCWEGSSRFVVEKKREALLREIPTGARIAVTVNPSVAQALALRAEGFDIVQVHFDPQAANCDVVALSQALTPAHLWFAPKVAPGNTFPEKLIPLAQGLLQDAYKVDAFGGTGQQADWSLFEKTIKSHPQHLWILAGGLGPTNVLAASRLGAGCLDLNSGIELSPGLKSAEKLALIWQELLKNTQS
jgi:phosphoribosylanthranilate isomerase